MWGWRQGETVSRAMRWAELLRFILGRGSRDAAAATLSTVLGLQSLGQPGFYVI